jgi:hypothetical protein
MMPSIVKEILNERTIYFHPFLPGSHLLLEMAE